MENKMDPEKQLSQFHHCDDCAGGLSGVAALHEEIHQLLSKRKFVDTLKTSPRECVMALMSCLCDFAATQDNPEAAMDQACETLKKLFENGKPHDSRRTKSPSNMVH